MLEDELNDEYLLNALADGAMWPLEALYHRYGSLLYALAYRMVGDHQIAEEVVQDTFVAAWQHATSYTAQTGSVRTWLFALTRHRAIDYLRWVRRRSNWQKVPWESVEGEDAATLPDVWEDVWDSLQRAQVREALRQLPPEQSLVIILAYFGGWTHTEIAQHCQLPFGTVKARLRLGLRRLKQVLEEREADEKFLSYKTKKGQGKPDQNRPVA